MNYQKANFNISQNLDILIGDLGYAKQSKNNLCKTHCGTPLYMAPEIFKGKAYDSRVDIWSLGTLFYQMLTGFNPFYGRNMNELFYWIEQGNYLFPSNIKVSFKTLSFLNDCLQYDPKKRISME
jgi:serine/threonine-protein kinase ULK/ATG1